MYEYTLPLFSTECFADHRGQACKEFVNRNKVCRTASSRSPELLARYADSLLKKGPKALDDDELERTLTDIVLSSQSLHPALPRPLFPLFFSLAFPILGPGN